METVKGIRSTLFGREREAGFTLVELPDGVGYAAGLDGHDHSCGYRRQRRGYLAGDVRGYHGGHAALRHDERDASGQHQLRYRLLIH